MGDYGFLQDVGYSGIGGQALKTVESMAAINAHTQQAIAYQEQQKELAIQNEAAGIKLKQIKAENDRMGKVVDPFTLPLFLQMGDAAKKHATEAMARYGIDPKNTTVGQLKAFVKEFESDPEEIKAHYNAGLEDSTNAFNAAAEELVKIGGPLQFDKNDRIVVNKNKKDDKKYAEKVDEANRYKDQINWIINDLNKVDERKDIVDLGGTISADTTLSHETKARLTGALHASFHTGDGARQAHQMVTKIYQMIKETQAAKARKSEGAKPIAEEVLLRQYNTELANAEKQHGQDRKKWPAGLAQHLSSFSTWRLGAPKAKLMGAQAEKAEAERKKTQSVADILRSAGPETGRYQIVPLESEADTTEE